MKTFVEYLIVAAIAVAMSFFGYWAIGKHSGGTLQLIELHDIGWTLWTSLVSVLVWTYLYRICRHLHWLVLPVMGLLSPIIGALLFVIPFLWFPFMVVVTHAAVVFPIGLITGLLISILTLPLRPKAVLRGNAEKEFTRHKQDPSGIDTPSTLRKISRTNRTRLLWMTPLIITALTSIGLGIQFLISDITTFRPNQTKFRHLIDEQRAATPQLPQFLTLCLEREPGTDRHVARVLLVDCNLNETSIKQWHARNFFWLLSVKWHFTSEERHLIYCRFVHDGVGHLGIQFAAQKLYQKPLRALNHRELASLIVFSRSPAWFTQDRTKLHQETDHFLGLVQ